MKWIAFKKLERELQSKETQLLALIDIPNEMQIIEYVFQNFEIVVGHLKRDGLIQWHQS